MLTPTRVCYELVMNIHDAKFDTCILWREAGKPGGKYYVRTDVKSSITELLQKIPAHLLHKFDYLPAHHFVAEYVRSSLKKGRR